ncbi:hypothetical protein ACP70R_038169 [Stipagrostis hirtigluma subsp. patula]
MDGADAFAVSQSNPWSLVRGYFSPATLFLLLNVVIGTIALTSRSHRDRRDDDDGDDYHRHQQQQSQYSPAPLARTSSVMDRLRSLGLYRFRSGDFPEYSHLPSAATTHTAAGDAASSAQQAQAQYARSRSEPSARPPPVRRNKHRDDDAAKKSATEAKRMERAPAQARRVQRAPPRAVVVRDEAAAAASVDERADDFINRFRQQLQLQRLNSLLNYREMLNRGT